VIGMERTAPATTRENTMSEGIRTIIYPVTDVTAAKAVYGALIGAEPYADTPYYVGFKAGGQDIGLDPNGHKQGMTGPVAYHHVADIKASRQALLDAGAESQQDVRDVGGGRLIATVTDADGNVIGLLQDT
jgi:predicted enzyme related to lactoylglutathione lyase